MSFPSTDYESQVVLILRKYYFEKLNKFKLDMFNFAVLDICLKIWK